MEFLISPMLKELEVLKKYSIEPKFGFGTGTSVIINKTCYMLNHTPYSNVATLSIPDLKSNGEDLYYDFYSCKKLKEFKFSDFEELIRKIDSFMVKNNHLKTDEAGNIYFVTDGNFTKIGATTYNVDKRLVELQTGNAKKLSVIGFYEVDNKITTERYLHELFNDRNILNEWFDLSLSDINEILSTKPNVKRVGNSQCLTEEDIKNIGTALYSNYLHYDQILEKKRIRFSRKIEEFKAKYFYQQKELDSFGVSNGN
jgi:hypothetical protein